MKGGVNAIFSSNQINVVKSIGNQILFTFLKIAEQFIKILVERKTCRFSLKTITKKNE